MLSVLLQVNIAGESQKAGCSIDEAKPLSQEIDRAANLRLDGLMTIAPLVEDAELTRPVFRGLRVLRDRLAADLGRDLRVLSMGMSNDYPVAVQEGATMVRVGRAIFVNSLGSEGSSMTDTWSRVTPIWNLCSADMTTYSIRPWPDAMMPTCRRSASRR